jgi:hypothetical protein
VVGRLAADMEISVQLTPSPVTGVSARIVLPPSLLAGDRSVTAPLRAPVARATTHAAEPPRELEPAVTQVLTLPPPQPAPDGRIRSTTIEYVTVPGSPSQIGPDTYTFGAPPDGADRTPNGLRRRNPARRTAPAAAPTPAGERPPPISDSPEQVRARLTAFRSGVRRGAPGTEADRNPDER